MGGVTPLHIAAGTGNVDVVNDLTRAGAKTDADLSPFDIATGNGHIGAVIMLEAATQ